LITIERVRARAEADARTSGTYLNPDGEFLKNLFEGLKTNEERYGYPSCPCRLASGKFEFDRDIICPCDYRDPDVAEYGACYCALFVRKDIYEGKTLVQPVPERRPIEKQSRAYQSGAEVSAPKALVATAVQPEKKPTQIQMKIWYCKQCGYVCFREEPPYICPICKAKREMFSELVVKAESREF
jgi:ferredoxin-thioredoxin reductase catalytic subunit